MTPPILEDSVVDFCQRNTSELRFRSNEQARGEVAPRCYAAFIPRNEVGDVIPGEIGVYPAIIVRAKLGVGGKENELVTVEILIGTFDDSKDQQGSRYTLNLVTRLKDRLREQSVINEMFPIRFPLNWQINKRASSSSGRGDYNPAYPYYFAEMQVNFELTVPTSQYVPTKGTGDDIVGPYDTPVLEEEPPSPSPRSIRKGITWEEIPT